MELFAIVDIETTGGMPSEDNITEIAVVVMDGKTEVERFETLVRPQQKIAPYVIGLTGITNEMVADAPLFSSIALKLYKLLAGKIFVAHNVNFDYKHVRECFGRAGYEFNEKRLCTVRLSREIIKDMPSYNLGKLSRSLGISLTNAHRAMGDTVATSELFKILYKKDKAFIEASLKSNSRESTLPANLPKERFNKLPKKTGVYYFHNKKGDVIYIGKAKNLKNRVSSHFTGKLSKKNELFSRDIYDVSFELTGNELIAAFLEDNEIKQNWPIHNRSQKTRINKFGVFIYEDQKNIKRIGINKVVNHASFIKVFPTLSEARNWLIKKVDEFNLKPSYCGMEQFDKELTSIEEHVVNTEIFLKEFNLGEQTILIKGKGRSKSENSFVFVEKGSYKGYGFYPKQQQISSISQLESFLTLQKETILIRSILKSELTKKQSVYEILVLD